MDIRAAEISAILKEQIKNFGQEAEVSEVGQVLSVGDGIARVFGLDRAMAGEMIAFPHDVFGLALNLEEDGVGCVLMGESQAIREAIVYDTPGVTRDRKYADAEWSGKHFTIIDTGGYVPASDDVFEPQEPAMRGLSKRVKESFDPNGVLNPGRMWAGV